MRYDVEKFFDEFYTLIENQINDKLMYIQNYKQDSLNVKPISKFYKGITDFIPNADPFMLIDIQIIGCESLGVNTAKKFNILIQIHKQNSNDMNFWRHILRYQESVLLVIQDNFTKFQSHCLKVIDMPIFAYEGGNKLGKQIISVMIEGVIN